MSKFAKKKVSAQLQAQTLNELQGAFMLYDDKDTGFIHPRDLKSIIRAYGFEIKKAQVKQMLKTINKEYEDLIDKQEFFHCMGMLMQPRLSRQNIQRVFKLFDKSKTGFITANDLKNLATQIGQYVTDQQVKTIIQKGDLDNDLKLSFQDFYNLLNKTAQAKKAQEAE